MKLINVDNIDWQKGVFVDPTTEEPLPIIHKIATIEMLRDWQDEVKAIRLDKVKQTREEIYNLVELSPYTEKTQIEIFFNSKVLDILDKLIAESEEE